MTENNSPNETQVAASRRIMPLIAMAALGLSLWSWSGGLWDIWSRADARWIQWLRDMVANNHWSPRGHWPLSNWTYELILVLNHNVVDAWLLRLPSVVFGVIALMLTYRIGCVLFGAGAGWLAALIFAATAALVGVVPALNPGMMMTAWIMLALDTWFQRPAGRIGRGRIAAIVVLTLLGLLTAGWCAPLVVLAVIGADLYWDRKPWLPAIWVVAAIIASIDTRYWAAALTALVPPMAIMLGALANHVNAKKLPAEAGRTIGAAGVIASITILAGGLIMFQEPDWFWTRGFFIMRPGLFLLLVFIILLFIFSIVIIVKPRTPIVIGSAIALLTMANVVVLGGLKPAMNPARTAANISDLIEHYMPENDAVVGVIGKANDPRYHVHGRYRVKELPAKESKFQQVKRMPAILIGRKDEVHKMSAAFRAAGYTPAKTIDGLGRRLTVLQRSTLEVKCDPFVRLIALGDTGTGNNHQYRIGEQMARQCDRFGNVSACLLLGDNIYENDELEAGLEKRFLKPFDPLIRRKIPFYAALGNHDYSVIDKARFEMNLPWFNMGGHNYYAQTFGNGLVTVFFLDCETIKNDPTQFLWLENELRNCRSKWKVLINHIPMVASNVLHADNPDTFDLLDKLMLNGGVDMVLSGHNHLYERRRLLDGIQYVTIGSGGHVSDDFEFPPDKNRAVGYNKACCFSWMEITPDAIHFQVRNETGMLVDEFRLSRGVDGRVQVADIPVAQQGLPPAPQANAAAENKSMPPSPAR
ncbi:metallophosphoesterase [bacterium]|nr:metallophosphoesterase [bacterium]